MNKTSSSPLPRLRKPRGLRPPVLVLLAALASAFAATPGAASAGPEWPRLFIEEITVEGLRHAREEVLITESLLRPGRDYDEVELRDAVHRIRRLPFILDAEMALRKGSRRDRYELVIQVEEARPLFFGVDLLYSDFADATVVDERPLRENTASSLLVGSRLYLGKDRVAFVAVDHTGFQAGLSHYRLFGRPWTLSLGFSDQDCCPLTLQPLAIDPTFSSWTASEGAQTVTLALGVPLGPRQSLRFTALQRHSDGGRRRRIGSADSGPFLRSVVDYRDFDEQRLGIAWIHDTTDDPVFATRGRVLTASFDARLVESRMDRFTSFLADEVGGIVLDRTTLEAEYDARLLRGSFLAGRWWPLTGRQTASASLVVAVGRSQVVNVPVEIDDPERLADDLSLVTSGLALVARESLSSWEAVVTVRHTIRLRQAKSARRGQIYWESSLTAAWEGTSPDFDQLSNPLRQVDFSSAVAFRTTWGLFRIGFRILDAGESL